VRTLGELNPRKVRIGIAVLIVAVVAIVLVVDLVGGSDSSSSDKKEPSGSVVALSKSELLAQAGSLEHPTYWVGPRSGTKHYELTTTPEGRTYVRYLTGDAKAGDPRPDFLTIGTYPVPDAKKALRTAKEGSSQSMRLSAQDGYEVLSGEEGNDVYVVFENEPDLQIEVFSPEAGEALELVESGALTPLG
jgi:hypothetical protein